MRSNRSLAGGGSTRTHKQRERCPRYRYDTETAGTHAAAIAADVCARGKCKRLTLSNGSRRRRLVTMHLSEVRSVPLIMCSKHRTHTHEHCPPAARPDRLTWVTALCAWAGRRRAHFSPAAHDLYPAPSIRSLPRAAHRASFHDGVTEPFAPHSLPGSPGSPQSARKQGRVMLNVGGRRYETFRSTLSKYPSTLLGALPPYVSSLCIIVLV